MKKRCRGKRAKQGKQNLNIPNDAPRAAKWPDFAARATEIFGDRVLDVSDD
jgi:hypothetical protein